MRNRKEFIAIAAALGLAVIIVLAMVVWPDRQGAPIDAPEPVPEDMQVDAPSETMEEPPSAVGDINRP